MAIPGTHEETQTSSLATAGKKTENAITSFDSPEICVICLDRVSERAAAQPCTHDKFDLACLGTWLQANRVCPLCKSTVAAIKYCEAPTGKVHVIQLPTDEIPKRPAYDIQRRRARCISDRNSSNSVQSTYDLKQKEALDFRRRVYSLQLYSLYVGANRISKYRNVTPASFERGASMVPRAKRWIRRELGVFDFLNPNSQSFGRTDRRASNAEFLLEYIIAIIRSIDLKGSAGQAQELLKDFLGKDNANLFLHELESWLRSPYERLEDWDQTVQYPSNHS